MTYDDEFYGVLNWCFNHVSVIFTYLHLYLGFCRIVDPFFLAIDIYFGNGMVVILHRFPATFH